MAYKIGQVRQEIVDKIEREGEGHRETAEAKIFTPTTKVGGRPMSELERAYAKIENDAAEKRAEQEEIERKKKQDKSNVGCGCLGFLALGFVIVVMTYILSNEDNLTGTQSSKVMVESDSVRLGINLFNNGRYSEAADQFNKAIEEDSNNAAAYYWAGRTVAEAYTITSNTTAEQDERTILYVYGFFKSAQIIAKRTGDNDTYRKAVSTLENLGKAAGMDLVNRDLDKLK